MSVGLHSRTPHAGRRRGRPAAGAVAVAAILLIGVCVILYPSAASWFSAVRQAHQLRSYAETVSGLPASVRAEELRRAHAYNATLTGTDVRDPFGSAPDDAGTDRAAYRDYLSQLDRAPGGVVAELTIPRIGSDLPVYHGTSDTTLKNGVGHLYGTALPVGGPGTHAVLTGHRGYPESTLFTHLDRMRLGDGFSVQVMGETLYYRVDQIRVVLPTQTDALRPVAGKDYVTLITCTPLGVNSHRMLVRGVRVPAPPGRPVATDPASAIPFPWWMIALGATLAADVVIVLRSRRRS